MKTTYLPSSKRTPRSGTTGLLRTACVVRLLLLLLLTLPAVAQAQFNYTTNNGTITITRYTGPGGAVVIPDTINGLPVRAIGNQAFMFRTNLTSVVIGSGIIFMGSQVFEGCTSLTNVTIPSSVTSIGNPSFYRCTSLTGITVQADNPAYSSVDGVLFNKSQTTLIQCPGGKTGNYTIPSNVTNIVGGAFQGCTSLESVTIPSSVASIGAYLFYDCTSLTSITIPDSVTTIGGWAFYNCTRLTIVTIPNSVTSIGSAAYHSCTSLASVTIPSSVTSIGGGAFYSCSSLTSVTIPSSVTNLGSGVFEGCTHLTTITVDADNSTYSSVDGVLFNKSQTTLIQCPQGKIGNYTIPSSVTSGWLQGCASLTSVTIPSSITSIGRRMFFGCSSLTSVTIPSSVTSIGESSFEWCSSLTSVMISSSVTNIGRGAFCHCTSLTSVTIPDSVPTIGNDTFYGCTNLTSVTIGSGVTSIGITAFFGCKHLTTITVDADNSTYSSVGGVLFNKSRTTLIQCPWGKTGNYAIPSSVTSILDYAFYYCTNLNGVQFQGNAPSVGSLAFVAVTPTVYYLPGTTGWGPTFGGRPTALWVLPNPLILNNGLRFGVRTNQFGFVISWATNRPVVVEACTDLAQPIWTPVGTNTLTEGSSYFSDPQWTNHPTRFYRLRSP